MTEVYVFLAQCITAVLVFYVAKHVVRRNATIVLVSLIKKTATHSDDDAVKMLRGK